MSRPKGGKNHKWTNEDRLRIVKMLEQGLFSVAEVARANSIPVGTVEGWYLKYLRGGISALNPEKPHPGNPFAALHSSKSLTEEERLKLENMRLKVENERLKKGYLVKGVGANKEFVTLRDANSK